ncbi:MAG: dTDP-4-dehydrorhamnose 3,5-epimerase family protein, partial [Lachnospiraceae bacterium]|nr:dTDP-4-dehydrorhamnose 3,5-epimerase family protein [Lachnospiraceae bacterium]
MNDFIFKRSLLDKVVEITPKIIGGDRDIFIKSYERSIFSENGIDFLPTEEYKIIEDKGIFRGIHFQKNIPQKSLLTVLSGEAYI